MKVVEVVLLVELEDEEALPVPEAEGEAWTLEDHEEAAACCLLSNLLATLVI